MNKALFFFQIILIITVDGIGDDDSFFVFTGLKDFAERSGDDYPLPGKGNLSN